MTKKDDGIRILALDAENFHRLRVAKVRLDGSGQLIRVTGDNGAGKTTLLRAVMAAFGGDRAVRPETIREGADGGWVRAELTNGFAITRKFTPANPKGYLTIEGPGAAEGTTARYKQGDISGWLGDISFDLLALFDLPPKKLRETLLSLAKDPELRQKLDALTEEREQIKQERTPWLSLKQRAERTPRPTGDRPEPVDVSGEMMRLRELRDQERAAQEAKRAVLRAEQEAQDHAASIQAQEEQIRQLTDRLEATKRMEPAVKAVVEEAKRAAHAAGDPSLEIQAVEARVSEADAIQRAIAPWQEYDRVAKEAAQAAKEAEKLTKRLAALDANERKMLAESGIPVEGISFAEDGTVLLNARDLAVASGSEKIRMAFRVAVAANPKLRVCLIDEGNDLGTAALAEVDALCREHGIQGFVCRLGLEGPGEIVVDDGVASTSEADAEQLEF